MKIETTYCTIGTDPEVFLVNTDGNFVSSIGKVGGTKLEPRAIDDIISVQEDNVLLEYNIQAVNSRNDFVSSVMHGLDVCRDLVKHMDLDIQIVPSAFLPSSEIDSDPIASMFGCQPDYSCWTNGEPNQKPSLEALVDHFNDPKFYYFRTAGGHVHFGYHENSRKFGYPEVSPVEMCKWMDLTLGMWSITQDQDRMRRNLYGKAGCFRPKKYGLEYRTLSNFWLNSEELIQTVYDLTFMAYKASIMSKLEPHRWRASKMQGVQRVIEEGDVKTALLYKDHFFEAFKDGIVD